MVTRSGLDAGSLCTAPSTSRHALALDGLDGAPLGQGLDGWLPRVCCNVGGRVGVAVSTSDAATGYTFFSKEADAGATDNDGGGGVGAWGPRLVVE